MADAVKLREKIRSYETMCRCWDRGIRPGFRVTGDPPYLVYDGKVPQGHFAGCEWVAAVNAIYVEERKSG